MSNDEFRMTKESPMTNAQTQMLYWGNNFGFSESRQTVVGSVRYISL